MIRTLTRLIILAAFEAAMIYLGTKFVVAAFGATDGGSAFSCMLAVCVCGIAAIVGLAVYFGRNGRRVEF